MSGNWWRGLAIAALLIVASSGACSGELVPTPRAAHDARDRALADELERQLATLPGVTRVAIVAHRPFADPLAPGAPPSPGMATIALSVRASAPATVPFDARRLVVAALPELGPMQITLVTTAVPTMRALPQVGPFTVAPATRLPLTLGLGAVLALIAAVAGGLAWRWRPRRASA